MNNMKAGGVRAINSLTDHTSFGDFQLLSSRLVCPVHAFNKGILR